MIDSPSLVGGMENAGSAEKKDFAEMLWHVLPTPIFHFMFSRERHLLWKSAMIPDVAEFFGGTSAIRTVDDLADCIEIVPQEPGMKAAFDALLLGECDHASGNVSLHSVHRGTVHFQWRWEVVPAPDAAVLYSLSLWESRQESDASFREAFDRAPEGLFRTTLGGRYLRANASLAKMYGYASPAELIAAFQDINLQLYVEPDRRAEFVRLMSEQGFVTDFQSRVRRADGGIIWIAEFARTVSDPHGKPWYYEGSVIDITASKLAERALRLSEERFRWLAEATNAVPLESGLDFDRFDYVGPQATALLGFPIDQWTKPGFWRARVHPDDFEWVSIVRGEAIEKRRPFELEYRMNHADGRVVWIREIIAFSGTERDKMRIGGFLLNVTHRRSTEDSLRESRLLIEQIASASPIILYAYDLIDSRCVFVDGRVRDILGYDKEAIAEFSPFFLLNPAQMEDVEACQAHLAKLSKARDGEVVVREFRTKRADGRWVWLCTRETVFIRGQSGEPLQIVGTAEDITEQIEAIHALIANEELFRRLVETTKVIPFEMDVTSARFTYVGPRAVELLGYPLAEWYSEGFWQRVLDPSKKQGSFRQRIADLHGEQDLQMEFRVRAANGSYLWVRQILHSGINRNLKSVARGFLIDMTEGKKREEESEETKHQLRALAERNQSIREEERISVAREIHDELGQSLTVMKIELAWLTARLASMAPEVQTKPLLEKIRKMETMADATLGTVRRITAALRPPVLDELGLGDAIEWQATEFGNRVGLRIELRLHPVDPVPPQIATVVFRIFQEILTNVIRHAQATAVEIVLSRDEQALVLAVSDNGRGIRREDQRKAKSFGLLGMRERATAVGGTVEIRAVADLGTSVYLRIPFKKAVEKPIPARSKMIGK